MHIFGRITSTVFIFFAASLQAADKPARIVGSTAIYGFVTMVAERIGKTTGFRTPIIEATGTGGGIKIFCGGSGKRFPDAVNSSRPMSNDEKRLCRQNGVDDILEFKIGYDGIVIGTHPSQKGFSLTRADLSKALAEEAETPGGWRQNFYKTWREVDERLPDQPIVVLGPTSTLATREIFEEKVIRDGCYQYAQDKQRCSGVIREDGPFSEVAEHDTVVIQKLELKPQALGFVSYGYYMQNPGKIKPLSIDGIMPSPRTIADGSYPLSRPLYIYVKKHRLDQSPGLQALLRELYSDAAAGEHGYLLEKGLIPLPEAERREMLREIVDK